MNSARKAWGMMKSFPILPSRESRWQGAGSRTRKSPLQSLTTFWRRARIFLFVYEHRSLPLKSRRLQETIATAKKSGYFGYQLEAQLALGEIETASGDTAIGQSVLTDVRKQAQQKGF